VQEVDSNVAEAQIPIEQLEKDYRKIKSDLDARYSRSQELSQLINRDVDKLETENRAIEKWGSPYACSRFG
jgi:DNA repair protein RAD50